jgi:glutamate dehydrogenase
MGATFAYRLTRDTGRSVAEVAHAWVVAARLANHREIYEALSVQGDGMQTTDAYRWLTGLSRVLERTTRWVLANGDPEESLGSFVASRAAALEELRGQFADIVAGPDRKIFRERVRQLVKVGAPEALAQRLVTLRFLDQLLEILRIATLRESSPSSVGRAFYRISEELGVPWLREHIAATASEDRWEQRAALALGDDLTRIHHRIVSHVVDRMDGGARVSQAIGELLVERARDVERVRALLTEIDVEEDVTLSALSVAVRELGVVADRIES